MLTKIDKTCSYAEQALKWHCWKSSKINSIQTQTQFMFIIIRQNISTSNETHQSYFTITITSIVADMNIQYKPCHVCVGKLL